MEVQYFGFPDFIDQEASVPITDPEMATQNVGSGGGQRGLTISYPAGEFTVTGNQFITATVISEGSFPITVERNLTDPSNNAISNARRWRQGW